MGHIKQIFSFMNIIYYIKTTFKRTKKGKPLFQNFYHINKNLNKNLPN